MRPVYVSVLLFEDRHTCLDFIINIVYRIRGRATLQPKWQWQQLSVSAWRSTVENLHHWRSNVCSNRRIGVWIT